MYEEQNNELVNSFLERTFFKNYRLPKNSKDRCANWSKFEMVLTSTCNLGCKYCYLHKHGKQLYPDEIKDEDKIINNVSILTDWLIENKMTPEIELFTGEMFAQEMNFEVLNVIYNKYKDLNNELKPPIITVPTNYSFLLDERTTQRVEENIQRFKEIGIRLGLSASVDGKYLEHNRPFTKKHGEDAFIFKAENGDRDDEFYDKLFAFNKKYKMGFHPMVYSNDMHLWKENWLWFQENFEKYNIPFNNIYLLEVRNEEWSQKQIEDFSEFIEFLIKWTFYKKCNQSPKKFRDFIFKKKGYNILSKPLSSVGRGIGCSIQSCLPVRMGDLSVFPCHRTMYDQFKEFEFTVEDNKITGIRGVNPEMIIAEKTFQGKTLPMCETCVIKESCSLGCLGSQYESTGEMFSPIPTVCKLEHTLTYTIARTLDELEMLRYVTSISDRCYRTFNNVIRL